MLILIIFLVFFLSPGSSINTVCTHSVTDPLQVTYKMSLTLEDFLRINKENNEALDRQRVLDQQKRDEQRAHDQQVRASERASDLDSFFSTY